MFLPLKIGRLNPPPVITREIALLEILTLRAVLERDALTELLSRQARLHRNKHEMLYGEQLINIARVLRTDRVNYSCRLGRECDKAQAILMSRYRYYRPIWVFYEREIREVRGHTSPLFPDTLWYRPATEAHGIPHALHYTRKHWSHDRADLVHLLPKGPRLEEHQQALQNCLEQAERLRQTIASISNEEEPKPVPTEPALPPVSLFEHLRGS
jgi:hypothetical protein